MLCFPYVTSYPTPPFPPFFFFRLIQTPRLYHIYISNGMVGSFQDMLDNFFRPLFEASASPTDHPKLARFLEEVVGFDSVDDESKPEYRQHSATSPAPDKWTDSDNPPYSYVR